ncbi:MAG: hypothetical protein QF596_06120 [Acidimicrobiales bacterium]|jgi:hypothetical protein|nr:hypothetical protein [Acidimicrobiales bacterium]MDP6298549.1 hypothetical protein [Acidimicrobiales bacterium]HJM29142.1 hypothetical protein [Acidimicrobiales bacterium]HJM97050.1 hypothetical protein [Acidimicrobiales bacterium]
MNREGIIHNINSNMAALSMLWGANYVEGCDITVSREHADAINKAIADIRSLLEEYETTN